MTEQEASRIRQAVRAAVEKIQRFRDRSIGEQNTKASLIEPILEALGWNVRDPDEVHREFKPTSQDKPVDYALCLMREPRLLVEAKGLGELLSDHRWIAQVLSYATVAGVEWCILTDGNEYCFYNATAHVPAEEKLFHKLKLTECNESEAVHMLGCLAPANLEKNLLDEFWNTHFVDRRVKSALLRMTASPDKGLVRLLRKRVPRLTPRQITQSLRRLTIRIELPTVSLSGVMNPQTKRSSSRKGVAGKGSKSPRSPGQVALADLIAAGLLRPPVRLYRKYKGQILDATLTPDGKVTFQGADYDTCSGAAGAARASVVGRPMRTNGWSFWQYDHADGRRRTLDDARREFLRKPPSGKR
jgi:predicted type IV restriction endonuclease